MSQTRLSIQGDSFLINDRLTYAEIPTSLSGAHGLLMNARFIQGVFDDKAASERFARFGHDSWDASASTDRLIAALPGWHAHGLRAFTVGFQGGGPCFTVDNATIHNNPYGDDGLDLDPAYADRMDRLIRGADAAGMVVIVSYFYGAQARRLRDGRAVRNAVTAASRFLKAGGYSNVIIEVANEMNISSFAEHPLILEPEGMATLIDLARRESGGLPVGCSGGGGYTNREVAEASDVILIHGNGTTRQRFYIMIQKVKSWNLDRPIVCNEDSQAIGQLQVAFRTHASWGYYNNMTKQEPPADWSITPGEDTFFARRMAEGIGIPLAPMPEEERYHLHGLEPLMTYEGMRWIRLGSLYPESIDTVDFFCDDELVYTAYDEPFAVNFITNWRQGEWVVRPEDKEWRAVIRLCDGRVIERTASA